MIGLTEIPNMWRCKETRDKGTHQTSLPRCLGRGGLIYDLLLWSTENNQMLKRSKPIIKDVITSP